jgi:hypothetical protein
MKLYIILIGVILLGSALVAAQAQDQIKENKSFGNGLGSAKNMTFGKCVSEGAVLKKSCYNETKSIRAGCRDMARAQNDSLIAKQARAQCNQDYKLAKKECKTAFKSAKKECKKIKHSFMETIGSSLK